MDAVTLLVVVAWCSCGLGHGVMGASDPDLGAPPLTSEDGDNHLPPVTDNQVHLTTEIVKQMLTKRCAHHYSLPCLKLDLARLVDRLSGTPDSFQILPGVTVRSHNITRSEDFPAALAQALARDNSDRSLDDFLVAKLGHYLSSLTLSVQLAEPAAYLARAPTSEEGRRRKNGMGGLMTAGLFSGGTLMAVGMSALAALAGKALMTALLSLMLSALAAMRGGGDSGGGGKTTYEIIAKPIVTHAHTHSSEVQHEAHGGHHHAYAYARSLDFAPVLPAGSNNTRDSYMLAYRAQRPSATQEPTEAKE